MADIDRMVSRLSKVRGQMIELHASESSDNGEMTVQVGRLKQARGPRYQEVTKEEEVFMKYREEKSEKELLDLTENGDFYDFNLDRGEIKEEYKVTLNDLLPLVFYQVNNGISSKATDADMSLSCFSIDELEAEHILTNKARTCVVHPGQENDTSAEKPHPDESTGPSLREDELVPPADLMSYVARLEKNTREIDSRVTLPIRKLQLPYENFSWLADKKPMKYKESVPFTKAERLVGIPYDPEIQAAISDNRLLDTRKYFSLKTKKEYLFDQYAPPRFSTPLQSTLKTEANAIEISDDYQGRLRVNLAEAKDKALDIRLHDKGSVLGALERLDRFFLDSFVNLSYQNKIIADHNAQLEARNDRLAAAGKKANAQIESLHDQSIKTKEQLLQRKAERDRLVVQDIEENRKDELGLELYKQKLNLDEAKSKEDILREILKDKKLTNKRLTQLLDKVKKTMQRDNWKLRGITRTYESKKSLGEIVAERSTPAGRNISPKKMMFKSRAEISVQTLQIIETQEKEDKQLYEEVERLVSDRWLQFHDQEKHLIDSDIRVGYTLDKKIMTKPPEIPIHKNIGKGPLLTILEDALREYDSTDPTNPNLPASNQKKRSPSKEKEGQLLRFDSQDELIETKHEPAQTFKKSFTKPLSASKHQPVDTRPYAPNVMATLQSHKIVEANIVNKPQGYIETRLGKELRGEPTHCHNGQSRPGPSSYKASKAVK